MRIFLPPLSDDMFIANVKYWREYYENNVD